MPASASIPARVAAWLEHLTVAELRAVAKMVKAQDLDQAKFRPLLQRQIQRALELDPTSFVLDRLASYAQHQSLVNHCVDVEYGLWKSLQPGDPLVLFWKQGTTTEGQAGCRVARCWEMKLGATCYVRLEAQICYWNDTVVERGEDGSDRHVSARLSRAVAEAAADGAGGLVVGLRVRRRKRGLKIELLNRRTGIVRSAAGPEADAPTRVAAVPLAGAWYRLARVAVAEAMAPRPCFAVDLVDVVADYLWAPEDQDDRGACDLPAGISAGAVEKHLKSLCTRSAENGSWLRSLHEVVERRPNQHVLRFNDAEFHEQAWRSAALALARKLHAHVCPFRLTPSPLLLETDSPLLTPRKRNRALDVETDSMWLKRQRHLKGSA